MNTPTIEDDWKEFYASIGLVDAPDIQKREMRRAFFAGQLAMFLFQMKHMANVADDLAMQMLADREGELRLFAKTNFGSRN